MDKDIELPQRYDLPIVHDLLASGPLTMASITLKRVQRARDFDADAVKISLFRDEAARVCGWFIGPVRMSGGGVDIAYLPRSERVLASVAVVRAVAAANRIGVPLCLVDPDHLWEPAWNA